MLVTIFGGSLPLPASTEYQNALLLGNLLGAAGHTVITGGYTGTMEAVSRGAAEAGGKVIGVTSDEIEAWRSGDPNVWVQKEVRFKTAHERLIYLIDNCDAAIALPGGAGTLAEIAVLWKQMIISGPRPLILVGSAWQEIFDAIFKQFRLNTSSDDKALLIFLPTAESAAAYILSQDNSFNS